MSSGKIKLRFVLVRPRNPLNIGAAARAMANFGFSDLVAVKPYEPIWQETKSAVGAEEIILKARAVKSLSEATHDCHLVLGTTAVRDRKLARPIVPLPEISNYLEKTAQGSVMQVALLFGSEKTGLTEPYLERCNAYVTIPTSPQTPSMNLSHAVALACYELGKAQFSRPWQQPILAEHADYERLTQQTLSLFEAAGYLSHESIAQKTQKIRQSFLQWNLRSTDVRVLHGIFRYLMRKLK